MLFHLVADQTANVALKKKNYLWIQTKASNLNPFSEQIVCQTFDMKNAKKLQTDIFFCIKLDKQEPKIAQESNHELNTKSKGYIQANFC